MVDIIKLKIQNRIIFKNKHFIQSIFYKLIHFKKANLVKYKNNKKSLKIRNIKANMKIKQTESDIQFIQKP